MAGIPFTFDWLNNRLDTIIQFCQKEKKNGIKKKCGGTVEVEL